MLYKRMDDMHFGMNTTEKYCVVLGALDLEVQMLICLFTGDVNFECLVKLVYAKFFSVMLVFFPL